MIGKNGKAYATLADEKAFNSDQAPVAVIVYVGESAGDADTGYRGLAIALSDANDGATCAWGDDTATGLAINSTFPQAKADLSGIANTNALKAFPAFKAAIYAYSEAPLATTSNWFLPSSGQLIKILIAYGYELDSNPWFDDVIPSSVIASLNTAITSAGGTALSDGEWYWTSTDSGAATAICLCLGGNIQVLNNAKGANQRVRPFLAF